MSMIDINDVNDIIIDSEYSIVDSDSLGVAVQKKINLSKTVRKLPLTNGLERAGAAMRDEVMPMPNYEAVRAVALPFHLLGYNIG